MILHDAHGRPLTVNPHPEQGWIVVEKEIGKAAVAFLTLPREEAVRLAEEILRVAAGMGEGSA